ncbi:MAG TPA: hypothetical protein VF290_08485 [Pyrinomonadaceae bacterium]
MVELLIDDRKTSTPLVGPETRSVEPSLLIPWSCRESFTANVCGLPGSRGCNRFREAFDIDSINEKGIHPQVTIPDSVEAWIVFEFAIDQFDSPFSVKIYEGQPSYRDRCHQAFFGFDAEGVKALKEGGSCYPVYLRFLAWNKKLDTRQDVTSWLSSDDERGIGLSACFGSNTFIKVMPNQFLGSKLRCRELVSIAGLIEAYLDNHSRCPFRRDQNGGRKDLQRRNLGITTCKVEVALGKRGFSNFSDRYLNNCDIAFSSVDPDTMTIRRVKDIHLGLIDDDIPADVRNLDERYFQSLNVAQSPERLREQRETNYAYCFSRDHRTQILPAEVGKSFLTFSAGEICSYLLHWFLLRIFACAQQPNVAFALRFQDWLDCSTSRQEQRTIFRELVQMPVLLPVDTNVFKDEIKDLPGSDKYLGIYLKPVSFGEALDTLGLGNTNTVWLRQTLEFLLHYDKEDKSDQNFQLLPMFEKLKWNDAELLQRAEHNPETVDCLEAIVHYLASGFHGTVPDSKKAQDDAAALTRSCVFPIAEALPHLSSQFQLPLYYIVPLWEDTIGQWHGPVIFAHVFTRAMPYGLGEPNRDQDILDMGTDLQNLLLPIVSAIAHSNYIDAARKYEREAEEQKNLAVAAYKLGHPLKDRVGPVRAIINTVRKEVKDLPSAARLMDIAGDLLTRISQLGHLLDITSVAMGDKKGAAAFLKEGKQNIWRVQSNYELREKLLSLSALGKGLNVGQLVLPEEDLTVLNDARIEPWIRDSQDVIWRPGDLFYDEVFSEVLTNAAKYGKRTGTRVTLRVGIRDIGGEPCLVMSNACQQAPNVKSLKLTLNKWHRWNTGNDGTIGGLFYVANSLVQTRSGSLYARVSYEDGEYMFLVGLQLEGFVASGNSRRSGERE